MQFWDCLFKVTVVDCVIRLMGFTGKGIVLLTHPSQPEECFRRRAQVSQPCDTTHAHYEDPTAFAFKHRRIRCCRRPFFSMPPKWQRKVHPLSH